jgi:hypothetical protein
MRRLMYVGQQVADELKNDVSENLTRYRAGDFLDLEAAGDWRIPLSFEADLDRLGGLITDGGPEGEIKNSLLVGDVLSRLTPTLARENRIWIRLSHVECLEYSRKRWLQVDMEDDALADAVSKHFFAPTLTACRDDHALSRLWWNHCIARQLVPDAPEQALKVILARADIRLNFVERPGIAARPTLGRGIVRALEKNPALLAGERLFQMFMKTVNLRGAGIMFEIWGDNRIDQFMDACFKEARTATTQKPTT